MGKPRKRKRGTRGGAANQSAADGGVYDPVTLVAVWMRLVLANPPQLRLSSLLLSPSASDIL